MNCTTLWLTPSAVAGGGTLPGQPSAAVHPRLDYQPSMLNLLSVCCFLFVCGAERLYMNTNRCRILGSHSVYPVRTTHIHAHVCGTTACTHYPPTYAQVAWLILTLAMRICFCQTAAEMGGGLFTSKLPWAICWADMYACWHTSSSTGAVLLSALRAALHWASRVLHHSTL